MTALREYMRLTRLHFMLRFRAMGLREQWNEGKRGRVVGYVILIVYGFGMMLVMYGAMLWFLFSALFDLREQGLLTGELAALPEDLFALLIGASILAGFILGLTGLLSLVFHARDAELYASMPLRPSNVFAAKFTMVYGNELLSTAALMLPAGLFYSLHAGLGAGGTVLLWLRLLAVLLFAPMIPMALASLAGLALSRFTMGFRRREQMQMVFQILLVVGILGLQMGIQAGIPKIMTGESGLQGFLLDSGGIATQILGYFPPAVWAGAAVLGQGMGALTQAGLFLLTSAASLALAIWLSGRHYFKGALAQLETAKSEKKKRRAGRSVARSIVSAVALREWRVLIRTPIYAMNALVGVIIFPLMAVFMKYTARLDEVFPLLTESNVRQGWIALGCGLFLSMGVIISPGVSTSFSREGRGLALTGSLPLTARELLAGKQRCYYLITAVTTLIFGASLLVYPIEPFTLLMATLMVLSCVPVASEAGILKDCQSPKLTWSNEAEAMKQNMNALFGVLFALLALLPALGAAVLTAALNGPLWLMPVAVTAVNAVLAVLLRKWTVKRAEGLLSSIGD